MRNSISSQEVAQPRRTGRLLPWLLLLTTLLAATLSGCGAGGGLAKGLGSSREASAITSTMYLHGTGANNNPPVLSQDNTAPTGSTAKYKDSSSIKFSGGNLWKEVGVWNADAALLSGDMLALEELHV